MYQRGLYSLQSIILFILAAVSIVFVLPVSAIAFHGAGNRSYYRNPGPPYILSYYLGTRNFFILKSCLFIGIILVFITNNCKRNFFIRNLLQIVLNVINILLQVILSAINSCWYCYYRRCSGCGGMGAVILM